MSHSMRVINLLVCVFICMSIKAQTVSYIYNALSNDECNVTYSVAKQDSLYYIVATVSSERMRFLNEPTMKIRTFNDKVITLSGVLLGSGSESAGVVSSNIVIPLIWINSTAQFKVTPAQFEELKNGVSKVRLSMTPMNHERTFKKDKIGKKLYQFYLDVKLQDDNF